MIKEMPSPAWNYFKRFPGGAAKCSFCKKKLSYKTSITNLKRHLLAKHKVNLGFKISKPFTKLDTQIDVKRLISLVREHHCLWDKNSSSFQDPENQVEAWNSIASDLCPSMNTVIAVAKLSERFCDLRDHYLASKLGNDKGKKGRPPSYYNDLRFLDYSECSLPSSLASVSYEEEQEQQLTLPPSQQMDVFEIKEVKEEPLEESYNESDCPSIMEVNQEERSFPVSELILENGHNDEEELQANSTNGLKYMRRKTRDSQKEPKSTNRQSEDTNPQYNMQLNNVDKDVLFLLSLSEEMGRIPKEVKAEFKSELMMTIAKLVQKYRRAGKD